MGYKIKDIGEKSSTAEPVPFLSSKERFLFFVEKNRAFVWGGIFIVMVLVAGLIAWGWLSQQKEEQAWELEGQAQQLYLDRPLDDVQKGKENLQHASTKFKEILEQYPGTASAEVSLFLLGNSLMEEKNYQEAIKVYTSFIQQFSQDPVFAGLVQQRLALAYLLNGNREAALKAFEAVLANPHALNKDQVLFEMAKLAEADEKTAEAVKDYKRLVQDFPLSPFASEAALRLKVLAPEDTSEPSTPSAENTSSLEDQKPNSEKQADQKKEGEK